MQPFLIVDLFDKIRNSVFDILQGSILSKIDFFVFQGLDKTLSNSVIIGVPFPGHANLEPTMQQGMDIIVCGILNPSIRMMDDSGGRISILQGPAAEPAGSNGYRCDGIDHSQWPPDRQKP